MARKKTLTPKLYQRGANGNWHFRRFVNGKDKAINTGTAVRSEAEAFVKQYVGLEIEAANKEQRGELAARTAQAIMLTVRGEGIERYSFEDAFKVYLNTTEVMDNPLNILVLSSSGAGKSTLQDKTLKLMPPEDVIRASAITDKALFHMKSLKNKLLALEEAAGMKDTYAIRTLISEGYLAQETVSGGQGQSRYVEGGCSIFQTTTNPEINPETKSRFFILGVDESRAQTRRILAMQRKSHTLEGLKDHSDKEGIAHKHWAFQRLLEPYQVVNPYAEELFYEDDRLQARRDQPKFLNLCKAVAFLNQMKKPLKNYNGIEYIEGYRHLYQGSFRQAL